MSCSFCGKDVRVVYNLPKPDGSGDAFGCRECGIRNDILCVKHGCAKTLFLPNPYSRAEFGIACLRCIEEATEEHRGKAEEVWRRIFAALSENEQDRIKDWLTMLQAAAITSQTRETLLLRAVMTRAAWKKLGWQDVVEEVTASRIATPLLLSAILGSRTSLGPSPLGLILFFSSVQSPSSPAACS